MLLQALLGRRREEVRIEMPIGKGRDTYKDSQGDAYRKTEGCPLGCLWEDGEMLTRMPLGIPMGEGKIVYMDVYRRGRSL